MSHPRPQLPSLPTPRLVAPPVRLHLADTGQPAANRQQPGGGRIVLHPDRQLDQRVRNAAHALDLSVGQLCLAAIAHHVVDLEREHNGGEPFPQRPSLAERLRAAGHTVPVETQRPLEQETA